MSVGRITYILQSSSALPCRREQLQRELSAERFAIEQAGKVGRRMEKAAQEITTEEIILSPEERVDEVKEEIKEVPSRLRQGLRRLAAAWERESVRPNVSESNVGSSGLGGMYNAKWQALDKE
jgi:hypothetical protein